MNQYTMKLRCGHSAQAFALAPPEPGVLFMCAKCDMVRQSSECLGVNVDGKLQPIPAPVVAAPVSPAPVVSK